MLEQAEIEYRTLKKAHTILQERNNELNLQLDAYKNEQLANGHPGSSNHKAMHGQSTIENCAPNNQISLYSGGGTGVITPGLPSGADYQRPGASISNSAVNPYRNNVSSNRSPYDQKLSEAKA